MFAERKGRGIDHERVAIVEQRDDIVEHGRIHAARVRQLFERVATQFDVGVLQGRAPARSSHRAATDQSAQRQHAVTNVGVAKTGDKERQARVVARRSPRAGARDPAPPLALRHHLARPHFTTETPTTAASGSSSRRLALVSCGHPRAQASPTNEYALTPGDATPVAPLVTIKGGVQTNPHPSKIMLVDVYLSSL